MIKTNLEISLRNRLNHREEWVSSVLKTNLPCKFGKICMSIITNLLESRAGIW